MYHSLPSKVSEKSDIWALGVTLYQLVFHYTEPPIKLEPEEIKHPWAHGSSTFVFAPNLHFSVL